MLSLPSIVINDANESGHPVVTGCPFPLDMLLDDNSTAEIRFPNGQSVEAQVAELTPETLGGIKWLELSFLSSKKGTATAKLIPSKKKERKLANSTANGLLLDNSLLQVKLNSDINKPPIAIEWKGGSGTLSPEVTIEGYIARESDTLTSNRSLRITRNGQLRCRVEISGQLFTDDKKLSLCYRLTVEMWKDMPGLRVDWMLSHELPGVQDLNISNAILKGNWEMGGSYDRAFLQPRYTAEYLQRIVRNPNPVTIIVDETGMEPHVADYEMLLDDSDYPHYCAPAVPAVPPWLQLHGTKGAVCTAVKDFMETRPNALESSEDSLSYLMVPENKTIKWPQGRRKQQNVMLSFSSAEDNVDERELTRLANAMFASGTAAPTPETLTAFKCFDLDRALPFEPGKSIRMNKLLDSFCNLHMSYEKWDLGDTPDWHYTQGYASSINQHLPLAGCFPPLKRFGSSGLFPDSATCFVEPAWTNNEYDMIHALASEVLRTGKNDHFKMLRWAVRHNVEVDFVAYSDDPRHHRGSPFHSRFHNTKGAITSHFWTQGLLEYYCLTGDDDALETALALGDKIIEINHSGVTANWKFDREIGWALLALVSLMDSGYEKFSEEADKISAFLQDYNRKAFSGAVKLSAGREGASLERQMIDNGFGYASMIEALDKYQRLTNCGNMAIWFNELLLELKQEVWQKVAEGEVPTVHNMIGMMMAIGFERTGDPDFLLAGELALEYYLDSVFPLQHPKGREDGQSKPCAMSYRGLFRFFGALSKTGELGKYEYKAVLKHADVMSAKLRKY